MRINSVQNYNIYSQNGSKSNNKNQSFGYKLPYQAEPIICKKRASFKDNKTLKCWEDSLNSFLNKKFDASELINEHLERLNMAGVEFLDKLDMSPRYIIDAEIKFNDGREYLDISAESPYKDYHYLIVQSGQEEFPIKIWESDNIPSEFDTEFLEKYLSSPSGIQNLSNMVDEGMEKMILSEIDNKYFNDHFEELFPVKNPIEDLK